MTLSVDQSAASDNDASAPPEGGWYPWYVALILSAAAAMSYVDRQVLALMTEAIKADLHVTDFQISLLQGLAFVFFYSAMAVPLGYLSDRASRRTLVGIGIFLWSIATAGCGIAKSFGGLFVARLGVGIGEATLLPCTQSLMPDYFNSKRLPRAFAMFQVGTYLGVAMAFAGGGLVLAMVSDWHVSLPFVGMLAPWQITFLIAAAPGPVIALLMFTVREPKRRQNPVLRKNAEADAGFASFVASRRTFLFCHLLSSALLAMMGYGLSNWVPSFFSRTFGWSATEIGIAYGLILLFVSGSGTFLGGHIGKRWTQRNVKDVRHHLIVWSWTLMVPAAAIFPLLGNAWLSLLCLGVFQFFVGTYSVMMPTVLQFSTPTPYRGRMGGFYVLATGALGAACGPMAVAFVTDYILKDELRLRESISIVSAIVGPIMIALAWGAYRQFGRFTVPDATDR